MVGDAYAAGLSVYSTADGSGDDVMDGGSGDDHMVGDAYAAGFPVYATAIADGSGDDVMDGGSGDDFMVGDAEAPYGADGSGNDTIDGDSGDDFMVGDARGYGFVGTMHGSGGDVMHGGADGDLMVGDADGGRSGAFGSGNDTMDGGSGDDFMIGDARAVSGRIFERAVGSGNDVMYGGSGDDFMVGDAGGGAYGAFGSGNDTMDGGSGDDFMVGDANGGYGDSTGDDVMNGDAGNDTLLGDGTGSRFFGSVIAGDDTISGGAGNDDIDGQGGDDVLRGGAGTDRLTGGEGDDTLDGGAGTDTAAFAGKIADYEITTVGGVTTVTDLDASLDGNDGIDKLTSIEQLQFADGIVPVPGGTVFAGTTTADKPNLAATGTIADPGSRTGHSLNITDVLDGPGGTHELPFDRGGSAPAQTTADASAASASSHNDAEHGLAGLIPAIHAAVPEPQQVNAEINTS
jgi:Ca2+-binding RTX toxin-like protein